MAPHEAGVTIAMMTVVAAGMEDTVARAMMTAIAAHMAVVMIMDLAALIATPPAAETTDIAEMIAVAEANTTIAIVDAPAMVVMVTRRPQEILEIHMEVEPPMTAMTIGTLVVRLRFANLPRCGALCQIKGAHTITFHKVSGK